MITSFHSTVAIDGLWIDMNEPSNFYAGSLTGCSQNSLNNPPLVPLPYTNIYEKTVCMDSQQYWGKHYSVHSLYGHSEAIATNKALQSLFPGKRPFILSRSTYIGSGTYTAHWTGDNNSQWPQMQYSITTLLEFQMFGIPFVGADICGFNGQTTEELCVRWHQLGAFYPFSRNHNSIGQNPQDPAVWSSSSVAAIKGALQIRYKLLPTLYTLFHKAHTTGTTVLQPLFFQWSTDSATAGIQDQFLWGSTLMVVPILSKGATSRTAYFPKGRWYDYYTGTEVSGPTSGRSRTLSIPLSKIGLFVHGGHILPWQTPSVTTYQSRGNSFGLTVGLDEKGNAGGELFWDDGETLDTYNNGAYLLLNFNATISSSKTSGVLNIIRSFNGYRGADSLSFTQVQVFGIVNKPVRVTVNGNQLPYNNVNWSSSNKVLTLNTAIPVSAGSSNDQTVQWYFS
jgi:alpha-glucosidase (family GH31 glycosyl hydrolase)